MTMKSLSAVFLVAMSLCVLSVSGQTSAFTQQGQLNVAGSPANGNFDFEFKLFDAAGGGAQVGSTQEKLNVVVTNGIYAVSLDFGAAALSGADRFLDIVVRAAGGAAFTPLAPRLQIASTPYSIRSLNAGTADTVAVGGVPAGSGSYIQNGSSPQAASNFNISGNGTAGGTLSGNTVNATTQFNINGNRVLSTVGSFNLFAGVGAGAVNTGFSNSFFGTNAGQANTNGAGNSFFGRNAGVLNTVGSGNSFFGSFNGISNTSGGDNSFFGRNAGQMNTTGGDNAFFGESAGNQNTTGDNNAFFGESAGWANTTGNFNAFFGEVAGQLNTTGLGNTFIGERAGGTNTTGAFNAFLGMTSGLTNVTGSNNTILGYLADVTNSNLTNATAVGNRAAVGASNSLVLGSINGVNFCTPINNCDSVNVGIGTTTPSDRLHINGIVRVDALGTGGSASLCQNSNNQISACSSSLRYKTNLNRFGQGLNLINQLKPITFDWKDGGLHDLGLGAEDVAAIEPLLVTYNSKGEVEGVKYDRIGVVLVNAVKEQQQTIERQQKQIDALKGLVCASNREADICKEPR